MWEIVFYLLSHVSWMCYQNKNDWDVKLLCVGPMLEMWPVIAF